MMSDRKDARGGLAGFVGEIALGIIMVLAIGAIIVPGRKERECELARQLARRLDLPIPGFGASDCRCGGHLFFAEAASRLHRDNLWSP